METPFLRYLRGIDSDAFHVHSTCSYDDLPTDLLVEEFKDADNISEVLH